MIFSLPWAWLGLFSIPALVAIYFLRRRARHRTVSSLLLWRVAPPKHDGGRRMERFEGPPTFWLELLILLLLVLAAAGPRIATPESRRPLVVVLDDSFSMRAGSMRAGGDDSPRAAARTALLDELGQARHLSVTLILAGQRPLIMGLGGLEPAQVPGVLVGWRALAPASALDEAARLALEVGGPRARILVLSDREPAEEVLHPRLVWRSFGKPRPNLAVVQAVRSVGTPGETGEGNCLVEVASFGGPVEARLRIRAEGEETVTRPLSLAAGGTARVRFAAPRRKTVHIELEEDASTSDPLAFDDRAVLLPEIARPVRVRLEVGDPALRGLLEESLLATGRARLVSGPAQMVVGDGAARVGDGAATATGSQVFHLRLQTGTEARPYLGPFVLDRAHPLTEGLALQGVIWAAQGAVDGVGSIDGAGAVDGAEGRAVISAGDIALLTDQPRDDGGHNLTLRWNPSLSTLQQTPNWPILWWNLLAWRADLAPGPRHANVRSGEPVALTVEAGVDTVAWRRPDGRESSLTVSGQRVELVAEEPGIHQLASEWRFAVNTLAPAESDLRRATRGRWGEWDAGDSVAWGYRPLAWLFLLLALGLLIVHLWLTVGRTS